MTTLEDVARWHDSEATVLDAKAAHSGFGKDCAYAWAAIKHRASAAACRELAAKRAWEKGYFFLDDGEYLSSIPEATATDAALAEIE